MSLDTALQIAIAFAGAYVVAAWFSLVIWAYRDIRSRSNDFLLQIGIVVLVLVLNLAGLLLYLLLRPKETLIEAYERSLEEEALLQEIEHLTVCPNCRQRLEPDFAYCPACRSKLKQVCVLCNRVLRLEWKLCPYCGSEATADSRSAYIRPSR